MAKHIPKTCGEARVVRGAQTPTFLLQNYSFLNFNMHNIYFRTLTQKEIGFGHLQYPLKLCGFGLEKREVGQ